MRPQSSFRKVFQSASILAATLALCATLNGCLVAGYTAGEGWWVWSGSAVVTLVLLAVWWLSRR